jgi:hypothetical protein
LEYFLKELLTRHWAYSISARGGSINSRYKNMICSLGYINILYFNRNIPADKGGVPAVAFGLHICYIP